MSQKVAMMMICVRKRTAEPPITAEKHRIYAALTAFRKKNGLGCFKLISEATGGKVSINAIANMYTSVKIKNETWHLVGEALERLREQ